MADAHRHDPNNQSAAIAAASSAVNRNTSESTCSVYRVIRIVI
jgi:hypothetical protein